MTIVNNRKRNDGKSLAFPLLIQAIITATSKYLPTSNSLGN